MNAHPLCYDCQGTGTAEDTLGNYRPCYCISDVAFRRRLDELQVPKLLKIASPLLPITDLSDWDLL